MISVTGLAASNCFRVKMKIVPLGTATGFHLQKFLPAIDMHPPRGGPCVLRGRCSWPTRK